jgi:hypothetical protein
MSEVTGASFGVCCWGRRRGNHQGAEGGYAFSLLFALVGPKRVGHPAIEIELSGGAVERPSNRQAGLL